MSNDFGRRLDDSKVLLSILDNLPTSIFVKDSELNFVYSNAAHCEMIGKEECELLGKSDADFYDASAAAEFLDRDRRVITTGETVVVEEEAVRQDGLSTTVHTSKRRLTAPNGETYLIGTNSDISELLKREAKYKMLADSVPVGILHIGDDEKVMFANELALEYMGLDGVPRSARMLQEVLGIQSERFPGLKEKIEVDIRQSGQNSKHLLIISSGWLQAGHGLSRSAIVSIVDLTAMAELRRVNDEVVRLNAELASNMKRLKEAQDELIQRGRLEQLGQLTATVAHELRNPLGAVRTSTFLMERKLAGKEHGVEVQLQRITNGVNRCDNIITQLLDFSRNKKLELQPGDLDEWLRGIVAEEEKRISSAVKVNLSLGLDNVSVPFDGPRLQRAIINLVSNASEAMVGDGRDRNQAVVADPQIHISTGAIAGRAYISVRDTGPGIPPQILARIREPLFTTKSFGTGLGVPAIEQIADQHGGSLDIESAPGQGATFIVWLPLEVGDVEAAA